MGLVVATVPLSPLLPLSLPPSFFMHQVPQLLMTEDVGQSCLVWWDLIGKSICDKYSGSMKIASRLDLNSHYKTASGTNRSNRWTYRVFITNTCRKEIGEAGVSGPTTFEDC